MVVYESMFGDNQQVARAIAAGLGESGVAAEAVEVGVAPAEVPAEVDLMVVGSPNHAWSLPRPATRGGRGDEDRRPAREPGHRRARMARVGHPADGHPDARPTTPAAPTPRPSCVFDHASTTIDKGLGPPRRHTAGARRAFPGRRREGTAGAGRTGTRPGLGTLPGQRPGQRPRRLRSGRCRHGPASGFEQQPPLGGGDGPARPVDRVGVDRDRRDAEAHEVLGELRPVRRRLAAQRRGDARVARPRAMIRSMASSTAASDSSNSSAQTSESRSTPSISWVRSLEPIDTPSMPSAAYSGIR